MLGGLSATIAVEYLRFENWVLSSGVVTKSSSGEPLVHESSFRRCVLLAMETKWASMEYLQIEQVMLRILTEVYECLVSLNKLRDKYAMDSDADGDVRMEGEKGGNDEATWRDKLRFKKIKLVSDDPAGGSVENKTGNSGKSRESSSRHPPPLQQTTSGISAVDPLFQAGPVSHSITAQSLIRQQRAKAVSFYRKVSFSWSLTEDTSDKDKIAGLLQTLKSCNEALESFLGPQERTLSNRLVGIKAAGMVSSPEELRALGTAARRGIDATASRGLVYQEIYSMVSLKARRVENSIGDDAAFDEENEYTIEENCLDVPNFEEGKKYIRVLSELKGKDLISVLTSSLS
jgi:hypothetical protein